MRRRAALAAAVVLGWILAAWPAQGDEPPAAPAGPATETQLRRMANKIKSTLFVPDPLPALEPESHGRFRPAPGVVAERVTYGTEFGLRIPGHSLLARAADGEGPGAHRRQRPWGDKFTWYAFYSGILYARAGTAVLTFDPIGEGERNRQRRSGTRDHDRLVEPEEMARRMGGLSDHRCDAGRLLPGAARRGRSRANRCDGIFARLVHPRTDRGHRAPAPCLRPGRRRQLRWPRRLLGPLGQEDVPEHALPVALLPRRSSRRDLCLERPPRAQRWSITAWPTRSSRSRARASRSSPICGNVPERLRGSAANLFRSWIRARQRATAPYFVTRPVALWLDQPARPAGLVARRHRDDARDTHRHLGAGRGVAIDRLYATEEREGGTPALGSNIPAIDREPALFVFTPEEWDRRKDRLIYESWVEAAKARLAGDPTRTMSNLAAHPRQRFSGGFEGVRALLWLPLIGVPTASSEPRTRESLRRERDWPTDRRSRQSSALGATHRDRARPREKGASL